MPVDVKCEICGKAEKVIPARAKKYKFCSVKCRGVWQKQRMTGKNHPRWLELDRSTRKCKRCGQYFSKRKTEPITYYVQRKFCSKRCADIGGFRYNGENHPNYREDARRKNRGGSHHKWTTAVISRDQAACQDCGAIGVELHAHHIKPYKDYPELRFDISNGVTLCYSCHWKVHTANNANGVNSGNILTGGAEDNPEPSPSGNIREGVTTRGRAYRRWEGECVWCGVFLSKRLSDVKGKKWTACSYSCSAKYGHQLRRNGGNSSKSALHESDDIV